ncbi:Rap guanine nucleotide exchange factor 2, partial [Nowakowskiella sp. JEL0078]
MRSAVAPFPPYMLNLPPPLPIAPQLNSSRFLPPSYLYPPPPRNPILDRPAPYPRFDSPNLLESSPLLEMDSRDLAKYLTAADCAAFNSISTADYISKLLDSNEPLLKDNFNMKGTERMVSPVRAWKCRIDLFTARANMIRNWVAIEICSVNKIKVRRRIIEKFIAVAKVCRELNNFQTLLFIVSGLLSHPVQRLKKTWEGVTSKSTLTSLERLLDPTGNMKNYRKALNSSKQPTIPFFPVVMKDLTFIIEGNSSTTNVSVTVSRNSSDTVVSSKSSESEATMINLEKYRTLTKTMKFYMDMSRTQKYQFDHLLLPTLKYIPSALYGPASYSFSVMDELNQLKLVDNLELKMLDEGEEGDGEDATEFEDNNDEDSFNEESALRKVIGKAYRPSTPGIQTEDEEDEINNSSVVEFDEEEILRQNAQKIKRKQKFAKEAKNTEKLQQKLKEQYYKAQLQRGTSFNYGFISQQFGKPSFNKSVVRPSIASTINYNLHNHSGNKNLNTNLNFFGGNSSEHGRIDCMTVEKLAFIVESRLAFADDELPGFWPEGGNAMAAALVMAGRVEGEK